MDSSWMMRRICSAELSVSRTWPEPPQRGHGIEAPSDKAGRKRWRLISMRPNLLMVPNCTRARSCRKESRKRFSTSRRLRDSSMSMKSMTIKPPKSLRRIWRATSSAASKLVRVAVSSISPPRMARAEFTSTETKASVWSITMAPQLGKFTVRA